MFKRPNLSSIAIYLCAIFSVFTQSVANAKNVYGDCMYEFLQKYKQTCDMSASEDSDDPRKSYDCMKRVTEQIGAKAEIECRLKEQRAHAAEDLNKQVANEDAAEVARRKGAFGKKDEAADSPDFIQPPVSACGSGSLSGCNAPTPPRRPPNLESSSGARNNQQTAAGQKASEKTEQTARDAQASAKNTTPQDSSNASSVANSDIALCESSYSGAARCCGNPEACVGEMNVSDQQSYAQLMRMANQPAPNDSQGLNAYCQQMQSAGSGSGNVNASLAGICNSKQTACSTSCSQLAQKYQQLINNCNGCDAQSIYQNTYQTLSSRNSSCNALASRVSQITNQAIGSASSGGYSSICSQASNTSPQAMGGGSGLPGDSNSNYKAATANANDPYGCAANPSSAGCQNCAQSPGSAACQALSAKSAAGTASFSAGDSAASKKKKGNFDIPSLEDSFTGSSTGGANQAQGAAVTTKTIANNSGGGIPGGGGGSPASLGGPGGGKGGSPGSPGYTTDILNGYQQGGYSSPGGSDFGDNNNGGQGQAGYVGGERPQTGDDSRMLGMDLKQFLPGQSRDPKRRLAGLVRSEINPKEEDIWKIISVKMYEKCKLGILMDCR